MLSMIHKSLKGPLSATFFAFLSVGCAWIGKIGDSDPVSVASKPVATSDSSKLDHTVDHELSMRDERDLKVAKLWARVDELEEEVYRQKERIVVLERGMTLGLVPEELKYPERVKGGKVDKRVSDAMDRGQSKVVEPLVKHSEPEESVVGTNAPSAPAKSVATTNPNPESPAIPAKDTKASDKADKAPEFKNSEEREAYELAAATAHESFRSGRYGRAIVEYSAIGKRYGDQVGGAMHLYWIAKSWASLKEYNTARQLFGEFIKKHGDSPWTPRAKLDLGRVEWQLGMRESALSTFRSIVQQHPLADAAEMARMELENLDKKL